jgi:hypothetical protein
LVAIERTSPSLGSRLPWPVNPRPQVLDTAVSAISHLRSLGCDDIEFTAEDASRSDPEFLCLVGGWALSSDTAAVERRLVRDQL